MYKLNTVVWEITLQCNLNCLHCGSKANIETKRHNELTTAEALSLVEQLAEINCRRVILSGGEPFMRQDWAVLGQRVKDLGMRLGYISNGFAINDKTLDLIIQLAPHSMSFSIDGSNAKTHDYIRGKNGVFDHVVDVIKKLISRGQFVSIVSSIHKGNFTELPGILDLLIECGVGAWQIQTATPMGRMPRDLVLDENEYYQLAEFIADHRDRYKNIIKIAEADCIGYYSEKLSHKLEKPNWQGCQAGLQVLGIESDGGIKGCLSFHGYEDGDYDDLIEGNIREKRLKDIWNDPEKFKYNRRFELSMLSGICKDCKYGPICRGGCSENAFGFTGSVTGSPFCLYQIEKKRAEQANQNS